MTGGPEFEPQLYNLNPHLFIWKSMKDSFDLFDSLHESTGLHVREGVKKHDIHIKPKSYKLKLLGELVISLVAKLTSIRLFISLAATHG